MIKLKVGDNIKVKIPKGDIIEIFDGEIIKVPRNYYYNTKVRLTDGRIMWFSRREIITSN